MLRARSRVSHPQRSATAHRAESPSSFTNNSRPVLTSSSSCRSGIASTIGRPRHLSTSHPSVSTPSSAISPTFSSTRRPSAFSTCRHDTSIFSSIRSSIPSVLSVLSLLTLIALTLSAGTSPVLATPLAVVRQGGDDNSATGAPPSVVPLPNIETPTPSMTPTITPTTSPTASISPSGSITPTVSMTASVTPSLGSSQSPSPSIGFDATETAPADIGAGDGDGDVSGNNDDDDGGGSNGLSAGAIIGISIAAIIVAIMLILCLVFVVFGSRKRDNGDGAGQGQQPAVYSSSDAAATPPPPPPPAVVPPPFAKDEARDMGAPDGGAGVGDPTEAAAAVAAAAATAAAAAAKDAPASSTDPTGALVVPDQADGEQGAMVAALARGPTPPPHDYVLGAGPAASRTDFDNLQARFEREEIGDHSAVLGVDRTSTGEPLAAAAILPAMAEDSDQQEEQDGGAVDDQGDTLPGPLGNEQVDSGLPDREAINVPTFEKQEQMMAGGDGSGAISNVAGGLHGTTITEEGGDVPSLERDPIEMSRDRDTPF